MKTVKNLSNSHRKYLNQAVQLAEMSDCRYKHGAVIRKSGRTISVGINYSVNDPNIFDDESVKEHAAVHAEVAALNACRKVDLNGAIIYVARINKKGQEAMSKPCPRCQKALKERGVKKVVYTIDSENDL